MGKYGEAAVLAVDIIKNGGCNNAKEAWELASTEIFGKGTPSQLKGCPKNTFLGLCEEGLIKGIQPGYYTKSQKNKAYALEAVELLKSNPLLASDAIKLWQLVMNGADKNYNYQMDVVTMLWNNGYII